MGQGVEMSHRTERMAILVSVTFIFLVYMGVLISFARIGQLGNVGNSPYYDLLSRAFAHGKLYLPEAPSKALLNLPDPYDSLQNQGLRLEDATLYQGRYYLYWGPVPALLIGFLHLFTQQVFFDVFLVWLFVSGLLVFNVLIILWVKRRFFDDLSGWFIILGIFLAGLSNPLPWVLGHPIIYEAAISGCQFFLVAGIYWGISGVDAPNLDKSKLFLAGLCWALAIGTRVSLLIAVIFLLIFFAWQVHSKKPGLPNRTSFLVFLMLFTVPLILMLGILGLYNYFRFGSFFEFGLQYQLAGTYIHTLFRENLVTSINYVIPSIVNYLFLPFGKLARGYPYLTLLRATNFAYHGPSLIFEYAVGLIWGFPFVIFSLIPVLSGVARLTRFWSAQPGPILAKFQAMFKINKMGEMWVPLLFGGTALFGFLPLLFFFFGAMRYQMDFMPSLVVLSIYGLGSALKFYADKPQIKIVLVISAVILGVLSILIGIWLGINSSLFQYCQHSPIPECNF
jgi:hypothetical protein